ncbi:MAG TPA: hypothetical protein VH092_36255 [Urbifossiella sp.]|jgi:predicted nucleic acid-binding Zn ribbon protein|nr:hypothetical protein [Urbifossiella sp.]
MPRPHHRDPDDDEDADDSGEYGAYAGGGDDAETVPCPHCGADVYEDAERCPRCEKYLSAEDRPAGRPSVFMGVMLLLALLVALFWAFGG